MFLQLLNLPSTLLNKNLLYIIPLIAASCDLQTYSSAVTLRTRHLAQICGGVLLQARWVLTAGHCVYDRRHPGSINIMGVGIPPSPKTIIGVQKIYLHDLYDPKTLENDISLLYLKDGFMASITYATIAGTDLYYYYLFREYKENSIILTWKENLPGQSSESLMELICLSVQLLLTEKCVEFFKMNFENDTMFCTTASSHGAQPCKGDSGSPIFVRGVVMGVVSFGVDCKTKNALSMFARVDRSIEFIEKTVRSHGHGFGNKTVDGFFVYYVEAKGSALEGSVFVVFVFGLLLNLLS